MRVQLQETAVEFVGLGHNHVVLAYQQVGAVVLGDSSKEGGATLTALSEDVRGECAGRGLAVCSGNSQADLSPGNLSQHPGALDYLVSFPAYRHQFLQVFRNGWGVNHQSVLDVFRNQFGGVSVMHAYALLTELTGQFGFSAVISAYVQALEIVVPGYGAHTYSAYAYEIYVLVHYISL